MTHDLHLLVAALMTVGAAALCAALARGGDQ